MARPFDSVQKFCRRCGTGFLTPPSRANTKFYCTKTCMKEYERIHGRPARVVAETIFQCKQCGHDFGVKPGTVTARTNQGKPPEYCSRKCVGLARRAGMTENPNFICVECGSERPKRKYDAEGRSKYYSQQKYCDTTCKALHQLRRAKERFDSQDFSKSLVGRGYVSIHVPTLITGKKHKILEHRWVMEQVIRRKLRPQETVHHVNGMKTDNRPENLRLFSSRHGPGQEVTDKIAFAIEMIELYPEFARALGKALVDCDPVPLPLIDSGALLEHSGVSIPT